MEKTSTEMADKGDGTGAPGFSFSETSVHLKSAHPELPLLRFWLLSIGLSLGLLLSFLDTSIVATSLFVIGTEFGALTSVNWVALSYTLAYLGCAVFFAQISDVVGRRAAFVTSSVVFIAFSIGCGFAQTLNQLIVCRALQGVGGSGLYSITMIIFPEVCPKKLQPVISGLIGIVITVSSVLGPVLGGILTHYTTWRWIFWINGPIGLLSMLLFYFMWPKPQYLPHLERRSWKELDYLGSILLIAAAVLVVFAFQSVGVETDQWSKAIFIAPLVLGVASGLGLFLWSIFIERRWGDEMAAAIPMRLLRHRVYAAAVLNTLFLGFPYILIIYTFPLRLQVVNGKDTLISGVMLLPMLGFSAVGSVVSGILNGKKDRTFITLFMATCLMVLGCGLLSTLSNSYEVEPKALGFLVFVGLGFGMVVSTATMISSIYTSIRDHAPAQGIMAQVRVLGGSVGIAASSVILGVTLRNKVGTVKASQLSSLEGGGGAGLTEAQLAAIRQAYAAAFNEDMRVCTIVAGVAILLTFGTFSRKRLTVAERTERQKEEEAERRRAAGATQA